MSWEQLRVTLNTIANSEDKEVLKELVARGGEGNWCLDLMVNATNGRLLFIDAMGEEDAG